jgi:hypothetical protein
MAFYSRKLVNVKNLSMTTKKSFIAFVPGLGEGEPSHDEHNHPGVKVFKLFFLLLTLQPK